MILKVTPITVYVRNKNTLPYLIKLLSVIYGVRMRNEFYEHLHLLLRTNVSKLNEYFKNTEVMHKDIIKTPFALRLDGVDFGKKLRSYSKPRDWRVHKALVEGAKELLTYFNADLTYVISDEVNVLFLKNIPYGARYEKIISISSGLLSSKVSLALNIPLFFDSRVVTLRNLSDVINYVIYRMRVGFNNYISSLYHSLTQAEITPPLSEMINVIRSKGVKLELKPLWELFGSCVIWEVFKKKGYNPLTNETTLTLRRKPNVYEGIICLSKLCE